MKNIILLAIFITGASFWYKKSTCEPVFINFAGKEWLFPSTVEEAVKNHQLDYKPPGYYYKVDSLGMETILLYHYDAQDVRNENQPREVLFSRKLHTYLFRFEEQPGIYDSLQHHIEQIYGKKFVLNKGLKAGSDFKESDKYFEGYFLKVDNCLTIGIEKSPQRQRKSRKVAIRYMYGLTLSDMGTWMGSFLDE